MKIVESLLKIRSVFDGWNTRNTALINPDNLITLKGESHEIDFSIWHTAAAPGPI